MKHNEMLSIILTRGLPASGKSTWALEEMRKNPGKYKRVNKDLMRLMIDANEYSPSYEKFILDIRDRIVEKALVAGFSVIIDDTNFSDKHFESMCKIAEYIGNVRVWEKYFSITVKEALERNAKREGTARVPDHVIYDMFDKHIKNRSLQVRDIYFAKKPIDFKYLEDTSKPMAIIVDVDGTVALATGRIMYDMSRVLEDVPNEPVCKLVRILKESGYTVIIVSGRDDISMEDTKLWLSQYNVPCDEIFMRVTGDSRKDSIVKEEIYRRDIAPIYNVHFVIDDRPQVVRAWRRNMGLTVLHVNDLDF